MQVYAASVIYDTHFLIMSVGIRSLVFSDLRSEIKGSPLEFGC